MKNEIYKINFAKYHSEKFKDSSPINPEGSLGMFDEKDYNSKHPYFVREGTFKDEKTFVENFGNPGYSVSKQYVMIVIEEKLDNISLKIFWGGKFRKVGNSWFKKSANVDFLTVNRRTGDVYCGYIHDYQKKRKFTKSIRRNYFLGRPVGSFFSKIKNVLNGHVENSSEIIFDISKKFFGNICPENITLDNDQILLKFYLDKRKIKYPNNFWVYSEFMWGKDYRKALKKNDLKIVDTFLHIWKINGKKLKKYLHETHKINIKLYLFAKSIFGEDWLNQDDDFILKLLNSSSTLNAPEGFKNYTTHEELKKIYSIFRKLVSQPEDINVWTFQDHLNIYFKLKQYGETDLKWLSDGTDFSKFQEEHYLWSEKLDHYRRGSYVRTYPEYFHEKIEQKIDNYFPIILTNSEQYNRESFSQQNCVKGYIGKVSSMIISLRKDDIDSTNRATIEYRVSYLKQLNEISVMRVQTLGKYNQRLDESWDDVLFKLDEVVVSCYKDKKFQPVRISKKCANGVFLESDSHFDENGNLRWTNKKEGVETYYDEW